MKNSAKFLLNSCATAAENAGLHLGMQLFTPITLKNTCNLKQISCYSGILAISSIPAISTTPWIRGSWPTSGKWSWPWIWSSTAYRAFGPRSWTTSWTLWRSTPWSGLWFGSRTWPGPWFRGRSWSWMRLKLKKKIDCYKNH